MISHHQGLNLPTYFLPDFNSNGRIVFWWIWCVNVPLKMVVWVFVIICVSLRQLLNHSVTLKMRWLKVVASFQFIRQILPQPPTPRCLMFRQKFIAAEQDKRSTKTAFQILNKQKHFRQDLHFISCCWTLTVFWY